MEEKLRILLCEDDESLGMLLREYLQAKGYEAELFPDGDAGYKAFLKNRYEMCVLDVMMPKKDGFQLAQEIRQVNAEIPIIFLTAKNLKEDIFDGFKIGADDYITKPFGIMEFLSRVRAALRRAEPEARPNVYSFREILLDNARHSVTVSGAPVELTYKEYSLLRLLLENTNLVVTRETILQVVWGTDISVESRTVDMHIRTLRKKLGDAGRYNCTVRKVGYKLADSEEGEEE